MQFLHESDNEQGADQDNVFDGINVPSFIRLFVIRRIIERYINDIVGDVGNHNEITAKVNTLASEFCCEDENENETYVLVNNIISRLINDGIKVYMNKWYNENKQAIIIEMIFEKLVLKKFAKEYNALITYVGNDDSKYQNKLFNSNDLMSSILEYLEYGSHFDGDLVSCSLVSSHWLYHAWNVNSVYYVELHSLLLHETMQYETTNTNTNTKANGVLRMWQRLINAKYIDFDDNEIKMTQLLVNRLLMLKNVHKIKFVSSNVTEYPNALKRIINEWRHSEKIEWCEMIFFVNYASKRDERPDERPATDNVFPIWTFNNAQYIKIRDLYFYRKWSNKCQELILNYLENINSNWCHFIIKNCDCSGVKILEIKGVSFKINESKTEYVLKQFALKFINLKRLKLQMKLGGRGTNEDLLLLQLFKPIILKNNGRIELTIFKSSYCDKINEILNKKGGKDANLNFQIDKLYMSHGILGKSCYFDTTLKFIQERDKCGLKHLKVNTILGKYCKWQQIINDISFESISIFEFYSDVFGRTTVSEMNQILKWDNICNTNVATKKVFLIVNCRCCEFERIDENNCNDKQKKNKKNEIFLIEFERMCQNINDLLMHQISFDITIKEEELHKQDIDKCLSIYRSYFENDRSLLSKYKAPQCNMMVCTPSVAPLAIFKSPPGEDDCFYITVSNVEHV